LPTYDGFGRRQKFLDYTNNSYTVSFLYDGLNPVHEQNTNGNNADLLTGLGLDEVFTRSDNSGTMSFLRDKLNSTVALADSGGFLYDYNYGPFGDTSGGGSNANPYQWTGRENDPSGLYYMRARYYDPTLQRFISPDPAGFGGGDVNLFRYAGNSPTNFIDPTGLSGGVPECPGPDCSPPPPPFPQTPPQVSGSGGGSPPAPRPPRPQCTPVGPAPQATPPGVLPTPGAQANPGVHPNAANSQPQYLFGPNGPATGRYVGGLVGEGTGDTVAQLLPGGTEESVLQRFATGFVHGGLGEVGKQWGQAAGGAVGGAQIAPVGTPSGVCTP
jgi:RHS repeat-associated protein